MIDEYQLGYIINALSIIIFLLIGLYHYVAADKLD